MNFQCAHDELIEVHKLQPNPKNPNKHPDRQIQMLAKIIDYQGQRAPIVVSTRSGFITKGHGRLEAIKKLGWDKAAVDMQDYADEAQEYADMVADNKIAELAEHDDNAMIDGIKTLGITDFELLGLDGFELPDDPTEAQCDEDEVPEQVDTRCKLGDVWLLGKHRLMCGDSTSIDAVEKLMNGERADMVFTDPPYGVDYEGGALTKRKKLDGDHSNDLYSEVLPVLVTMAEEYAAFYIWHAAGYADMASTCSESGLKIRNQIIWNKNQAQFGALSAQYKQKHEPCFYCHKEGNPPKWYGPTNEVTVWDIKREKKNDLHPTQKPVELAERALENSSKYLDKVLDLFGGSGSTLIACEKTGRKCFMMELDPHYCDVILARWEKYTGKKAELINGQT